MTRVSLENEEPRVKDEGLPPTHRRQIDAPREPQEECAQDVQGGVMAQLELPLVDDVIKPPYPRAQHNGSHKSCEPSHSVDNT